MKRHDLIEWSLVAVILYVGLAMTAYRFSHSDLTETELLLNFFNAIFWRW